VGIFSPLQGAYGRGVDNYSRDSEEGIKKSVFIPLLHDARIIAITKRNIEQAFATTGIVPFNPRRVYSKLKPGSDNRIPFPTNPTLPSETFRTPKSSRDIRSHLQAANHLIDTGASVKKIKGILKSFSHAALFSMAEKEIREKVCDGLQQKKAYNTRADRKQLSKARILTGKELIALRKAREELDSRPKRPRQQKKRNTTPITLPSTPYPEPALQHKSRHVQIALPPEVIALSPIPASQETLEVVSDALSNPHQNTRPSRRRCSSDIPFQPLITRTHMPDRPLHMKLHSKH